MATTKIINSMSLIAFAKTYGPQMQIGQFTHTDEDTGVISHFKSCIFTNEGERTFVAFSSNMGELSPREIVAQKDSLQVVQLESGNYVLCKQGENTWEEVDLGL